MKKMVLLLLCLVVITSTIVGCSQGNKAQSEQSQQVDTTEQQEVQGNDAQPEKPIKIAYLSALLTHNYFATLYNGIKDAADEIGNIEIVAHDANLDPTAQLNALENYIQNGYDGVIISPADGTVLEEAVKKAKEAGIFIIGQAQPVPGADTNIILNEYDYGFEGGIIAGQWIVDQLGGVAKVGILSTGNIKELVDREKGIEEGIHSIAPNAEIVSVQPGNTLELGVKAAETILQAHPDVKVIQAVTDAGALGACEALAASGIDTQGFYIGGLDAADEALAKMKEDGSVFRGTVDIRPYDNGKQCVQVMYDMIVKDIVPEETIYIQMSPLSQEDVK